MKITYIGHACFKIEKGDYTVIIDPYEDGMIPGLADVREKADMVLVSHGHRDHSAVENVEVTEGRECPFTITKIETFHDESKGAKRGNTTIHILDDGVTRVAHFGDIGCDIDFDMPEEDIKLLEGLDAAMIPVGGTYTIDGRQAVNLMRRIEPKYVIPMHFRSEKHGFGLPDVATRRSFTSHLASVIEHRKSWIETEEEPHAQVNVLVPTNS